MTRDLGLPSSMLDELFPFHFSFGRDGALKRVGKALRRVCPDLAPGARAEEVLRLVRPDLPLRSEVLADRTRSLMVLETVTGGLRLRGQLTLLDGGAELLFVGAPWITDLDDLQRHGIVLDDLPPHCSQADTLFLLRNSQIAAEDARGLVSRLERQQVELNSANRRLRAVLETAAEGIITMGADGIVRSFNAAASSIFGYAADEVVGKNVSLLMPPDVAQAHDGYLAQYLRTGVATVVGGTREVSGRHKDGHQLALELSVSDASVGEERLFTGILRDLLERKRFERDHAAQARIGSVLLRGQNISEIWAAVAEPIADAFGFDVALLWLPSPDTGRLSCAETWTADDTRFGSFADTVRGASSSAEEGPAGQASETGKAARVHDVASAGGAHGTSAAQAGLRSAVAFPVFGEKAVHGAVELLRTGILRPDPTLLGTLETIGGSIGLAVERAHALRLAEESAKAREEFLAHMSHEIRTPLSAIIGLAYLLESAPLGDQERGTVARLRYSAEVLRGLVNSVLDFAKLTARQMELVPQEYPLATLLSELTLSQETLAQEKGLTLSLEIDPAVPGKVVTDPVRLTQILMNLIHNAIKFTESGGVTVRVVAMSLDEGHAQLRFSVEDTGPGVAPADRERIFEAYTQTHERGASGPSGGTGLGLAIVRRLVDLMGGSIEVESVEGGGAAFHVTLPFVLAAEGQEEPVRPGAPADLSGLRILVADDSETNRFVASRILGEVGAEVVTAEDGDEALVRVREGNFDLVLMDLQMPGMDGYAAARAIQVELGPSRAPPVAALTARATVGDRKRVAEAGMVDMITKPFHPEELQHRVALLARRGTAPEWQTPEEQTLEEQTPESGDALPVTLIDRNVLMVQATNDSAFAAEILALFLHEASDILGQMEEALAAGQTTGMEGWAHLLKSQAGTVGAISLQDAQEELETMLRQAPTRGSPDILAVAEAAVALGRSVLEEAARLEHELADGAS